MGVDGEAGVSSRWNTRSRGDFENSHKLLDIFNDGLKEIRSWSVKLLSLSSFSPLPQPHACYIAYETTFVRGNPFRVTTSRGTTWPGWLKSYFLLPPRSYGCHCSILSNGAFLSQLLSWISSKVLEKSDKRGRVGPSLEDLNYGCGADSGDWIFKAQIK